MLRRERPGRPSRSGGRCPRRGTGGMCPPGGKSRWGHQTQRSYLVQHLAGDQTVNSQGTFKAITPILLPRQASRMKDDLPCEELPEHLTGLWALLAKYSYDVLYLHMEIGLDLLGVEIGYAEHPGEPVPFSGQGVLPGLLRVQPASDFIA